MNWPHGNGNTTENPSAGWGQSSPLKPAQTPAVVSSGLSAPQPVAVSLKDAKKALRSQGFNIRKVTFHHWKLTLGNDAGLAIEMVGQTFVTTTANPQSKFCQILDTLGIQYREPMKGADKL